MVSFIFHFRAKKPCFLLKSVCLPKLVIIPWFNLNPVKIWRLVFIEKSEGSFLSFPFQRNSSRPFLSFDFSAFFTLLWKVPTTTKTLPPSFWRFRGFYPAQQSNSFV